MSIQMYPLVSFDLIENHVADELLVKWNHWLGGCNRPFGRQSFGLAIADIGIVSVAVSASTVNESCGGLARGDVVELARCASDPAFKWATRVSLRLWRELAPRCWGAKYWPVIAVVSYSNALRHRGDIYRFDGWKKVADVKGGTAVSTWKRPRQKTFDPKAVWVYRIAPAVAGRCGL